MRKGRNKRRRMTRSVRGNYDAERIKEVDGGVRSDGRRGKVEEEEEKVEWKLGCIEEGGGWSDMEGDCLQCEFHHRIIITFPHI